MSKYQTEFLTEQAKKGNNASDIPNHYKKEDFIKPENDLFVAEAEERQIDITEEMAVELKASDYDIEEIPVIKKCRWCEKKYEVSGIFAKARKYCCDDCYNLGRIRQIKREFQGLNKGRK